MSNSSRITTSMRHDDLGIVIAHGCFALTNLFRRFVASFFTTVRFIVFRALADDGVPSCQ